MLGKRKCTRKHAVQCVSKNVPLGHCSYLHQVFQK